MCSVGGVVCRPHVVSVHWLVECLKQSRTVTEDEHICFDYNAADTASATNRLGLSLLHY